jgi:HPt (histidine-containing phosphotransfer) domain-containing protein
MLLERQSLTWREAENAMHLGSVVQDGVKPEPLGSADQEGDRDMIDWDRLQDLRSDIGEEDFADVAFLFVAEITERLDRLRSDPSGASAADFHFLRGSAANLGFVAMVDACHLAEQACLAGEVPDIICVAHSFAASVACIASDIPGIADAA